MSCSSFAGCSFLGVGIKFNPLDSRDISPGVNLYLLRLMMWVRILLNLLWCFVFFAFVFVCLGLFSLYSSFSSVLVWSLWIYSLLCLVFCSIVLEMFLASLFLIGSSFSLKFLCSIYPIVSQCFCEV